MSDSDDDVPISELTASAKAASNSTSPPSADSDDELSLADLKKKAAKAKTKPAAKAKATPAKSKAAKTVTKKSANNSTASAKKAGTKAAKKTPTSKTKSAAAKKKAASKAKPAKKAPPPKQQIQSSGEKLITRSSVLSETKKGELVEKLLCRWWYAMDWPAEEDVIPAPPMYEALEGYPGVYVCVEGDDIGKILDNRNKATCPCYTNFINKSTEELKPLLETALKNQKEDLIKNWGEGSDEEAKINSEFKWLKGVDPDKADRAASRALSKAKINN